MRPLVTVIIPVYNTEAFLPRCVQTVMGQTEESLEVWLIDDGSTDGSGALCDRYAESDERVHAVHLPNGGVSRARNEGLRRATGEYVLFVDSDDWLDSGMVSRLVALMAHPADMTTCGYVIEDATGRSIYRYPSSRDYLLTRDEALVMLFRPTDYRYKGNLWDKLFRRSVIEAQALRFDEAIAYNEDRLFIFQYLLHAGPVAVTTTPYYHYIIREGSAMAASGYHPRQLSFMDAFDRMTQQLRASADAPRQLLRTLSEDYVASALKFFASHAGQVPAGEYKRRMDLIHRFNFPALGWTSRLRYGWKEWKVGRLMK